VDQFGTAYVTGATSSTDFLTLNPVQSTNHGVFDAFVFRLTQLYDLTVTRAGTGTGTVTSDPAGIACGATCSARFEGATTVTLTATPSGKSVFLGWTGAGCTGTGPCTVTMSSVQTVTGSFGLASVTSLTANVTFPVPAGTPVTSLRAGYQFDGVRLTIGGVDQIEGITENDFTNPVTYTIEAADGTTADFTVTVTVGL
jgi:hypothetical protein